MYVVCLSLVVQRERHVDVHILILTVSSKHLVKGESEKKKKNTITCYRMKDTVYTVVLSPYTLAQHSCVGM